jgi:hypothetical protein
MQYNPNPPYPYGQQGPNQNDQGEKPSRLRWWTQYVIVPILVAMIGAGLFFGIRQSNNTPTTIPKLHSTYNGTFTDLARQQQFRFSLSDLTEDTNTGNFTAAAVDGFCTAQITDGTVNTSGHVTFKLRQELNSNANCAAIVSDFTGQVDSAGSISGQWTEENTQFNGSFNLS